MSAYAPSSSRFGSMKMKRTSSGVARYRMEVIMVFKPTLLPEPVAPATRRWGIFIRSVRKTSPLIRLPRASVSREREFWTSLASMTSRI